MKLLDKNYLANAIIRKRLLSICGSLVLTVLLGLGLQHLTFDPDFDTFFPENHPATVLNDEIDETFIPTDNIIIAVDGRGSSIFNQKTLSLIERLTEKSWTIPHSVRVDSLTNFSYVRSEDDDLIVEMINDDQGSFLKMPPPYMSQEEIYYMYNNFGRLFRENSVQRDRIGKKEKVAA